MALTVEQDAIVKTCQGYQVVLAGPGSGKTRTITEKVLYLIGGKIIPDPYGLLALTFTNSAANEMRSRLRLMGFSQWDRIFVGTYHSFGHYLLSCYGGEIGIREDFEVANSDVQSAFLESILGKYKGLSVGNIKQAIEAYKRQGIFPGINDEKLDKDIKAIYRDYEHAKLSSNLLDYGDLIALSVRLLENSDFVYRLFASHYRYLLVDEFQDTDYQQLRLVEIMAKAATGATIIADDDQSIFGWRGANRGNVQVIVQRLDAEIKQLGVNFRSDQVIVEAANLVIQHEKNRIPKKISPYSQEQGRIYYQHFSDAAEECRIISDRIRLLQSNRQVQDLGEIAVIARARWRASELTSHFDRDQINWFDRSQLNFEDSWDALLAISVLGLAINQDSSDQLHKVMATVEISGLAFQLSIQDALDLALDIRRNLKMNLDCDPTPNVAREILTAAHYWNFLETASWSNTETKKRLDNVNNMLGDLDRLSNQTDLCLFDIINRLIGVGAVQILTGQEAKGREFDHVFFIGLEDDVLPDYRSTRDDRLAEERRIFYVGLTRARKVAYLTSVANRTTRGGQIRKVVPSRFLDHIPPNLLTPFD